MEIAIELLVERLEKSKLDVYDFFVKMDKNTWEKPVYSSEMKEQWLIKDIFAHIVFAELAFLDLFKEITQGKGGSDPLFDIDAYNESHVSDYKKISFSELLEDFLEVRTAMIEMIKKLTKNDLDRVGLHPALGESKLSDMIKLISIHDQMHIKDIKKCVSSQVN